MPAKEVSPELYIVTPVYNREELLGRLYESLKSQTDLRFTWIIADDGSTDGTRNKAGEWSGTEGSFPVILLEQENGGKHRALNHAVRYLRDKGKQGDLVFIVDSDDTLTKDAVSVIHSYAGRFAGERESLGLAGFSFLRVNENGEVNAGSFPKDEWITSYREARVNRERKLGDKAEVFYLDILEKYPFPEFPGELFFPEDALWMMISGPHPMVHINRPVYICEYLDGGLTRSGRAKKVRSPLGMMYRSKVYLEDKKVRMPVRMKMLLLYRIYERFAAERGGKLPEELGIRRTFAYWVMGLPAAVLSQSFRK